jgi:hypothetical protein
MADLTPEALDALEKRLRANAQVLRLLQRWPTVVSECEEAADTIAAMRAAPVAMRERAAGEADKRAHDGMRPANGWTDNQAEWWQIGTTDAALAIRDAIRALPLDAPAPVAAELPPCCVCGSYMATRGEEALHNGPWVCCAKCKADAPPPVDPVATYTATVDVGSVDDTRRVYQGFRQVDPVAEALGRIDVLELARMFHEAYESLAPYHGYVTRPETRTFDPASNNGRLMIATCKAVLGASAIRAREGGKP